MRNPFRRQAPDYSEREFANAARCIERMRADVFTTIGGWRVRASIEIDGIAAEAVGRNARLVDAVAAAWKTWSRMHDAIGDIEASS